jgi:hypothetical protein
MAARGAGTCYEEGTHHKITASLAGTYVAYPCAVAYETEVEAADTSDSFDGALATRDSLGTFSRMALMIAFIGHLYLANW